FMERDDALDGLRVGSVTPVLVEITTWNGFFESMPALRKSYTASFEAVKKRPPFRPGDWLKSARLAWGARETAALRSFDITLLDEQVNSDKFNMDNPELGTWTVIDLRARVSEP
ncbi:MAG: hypothetical protein HY560_06395, partial [Gemmatimonadetes bacterium]|nr:hypothetical protein [Gemmatimonadota bacterium]